jgi:hypothetical protein
MAIVESITGNDLTSQKSCPMIDTGGMSRIYSYGTIHTWKGQKQIIRVISGMQEADVISTI